MPVRHTLTILAVGDLDRAVRFYAEAFGWTKTVAAPSYAEFVLPDGMRLGLYRREGFAVNTGALPAATPAGAITPTELYLTTAEPEAAIARLRAAGARLLGELAPRDWGEDVAYLADPDGNVLAVARAGGPADAADLRALARRWLRPWQGGDSAVLDELHAADFVDHAPAGRASDTAGVKRGIAELYAAFPDFWGDADDLWVDENAGAVTIRWSATGTHRGPFLGVPPTGRPIRFRGLEILRIRAGRVVERWGEWDGLDIAQQLGAPSPRS